MVEIVFKNVGQGDSIILEWESSEEGTKKIAIIDCNLNKNENPVLQHLIELNLHEIEFVILSHPHEDHFSGFHELLSCN